YFFARDPNYDPTKFDPSKLADRMKEVSNLMDSTNPDLSAFSARGAKLIMFENMADYAQSPYAGIDYYKSVETKMGAGNTDSFSRLYVLPGVDHMGGGAPGVVDLFAVLTDWVERGKAPGDLAAGLQDTKAPFAVTSTRPLCRYPAYPRYRGGDATKAESFQCEAP
ncbi:MAG: tannase/feruloyl esterase family alpha/beta hydrolase, partial [Bradyrhizobium sp.]|nr:tannase/feruloyl esterase family alpha/beta hydrolase [Bradyrhizobium sp.]